MADESAIIGLHIGTMINEEENISESKKQLQSQYEIYFADNEALRNNWEGDTAKIFLTYSNCMNKMLQSAIGITDVMGQNINTFFNETALLDAQAGMNAGGEK